MKRFLSCLAIGSLCLAQNETPVLRSTTRLIQMNVIATDRNGRPITDLTQNDFSLKDNSSDQKISVFSLENSAAPKNVSLIKPPAGDKVFRNRPKVEVTGLTVMLFDGLNTKTEDQIYARQQMIKSLAAIPPTERVSLYVLGSNLRLLHDFTTDTATLLKVLQKHGARINMEVDSANFEASDTGDSDLDDFLNAENQKYSDYINVSRAQMTLAALEAIAKRVQPIPGRKNLVWISGGFPFSIGQDDGPKLGDTRDRRNFSDESEKAARLLNDAQLAVYPVDARGLRTANPTASSQATFNPRKPPNPSTGSIGPDHEFETMQILADRTGGRAFHNSNDLAKAVLTSIDDAKITYSMGFYPTNQVWDGKFHKLKLKVDRPGVQLRYRSGYFAFEQQPDAPAPVPVPQTLDEAMVAPELQKTIGIQVGLTKETVGYLATVAVDPRELKLTQTEGKWTGAVQLQIVTGRQAERHPAARTTRINIALTQAAYAEALELGFRVKSKIELQPGQDEVRIGMRDMNSGATGTLYLAFSSKAVTK